MLIDLKLDGKIVMVIGGGAEAHRKTQSFLESGATIWVISRSFSREIEEMAKLRKVSLVRTAINDANAFIGSLSPRPDILLAATDDAKLNTELVRAGKSLGSMVYAVDNPALSDFILPAVARISDVKIAVSTSGRSPAMARVLRQRIEEMVTPQDILTIQLQADVRSAIKKQVADPKQRSNLLYKILNNSKIKELLKEGKLSEAQELATKIVSKKEME